MAVFQGSKRWLAVAVAVALHGTAWAQDTATSSAGAGSQSATVDSSKAKPKNLDTVIVTGTRADNRTESSSLTPIDVVSAKVLQQTGTTELTTALARIIPSLNFPRPSGGDTADQQRPLQMRGLSPDQVLVLVDGKRWHPGALLLTNGVVGRGSQAVDLNTIPMAAIDHIEVLRDGASAEYGSDAIAGVINIILKKGAKGGEVTATGGEYYKGDGRQWQGDANFGIPLNGDKGWLRFTLQSGNNDYTNRAEYEVKAPYEKGQRYGDPASHNQNIFINGQYDFSPDVQGYVEAHYSHRNTTSAAFFRDTSSSNAVLSMYPNGYLPLEQGHSIDQSLVAGLRGTVNGWRWDVSGNYGSNRVSYDTIDSVNRAWLNDYGYSPTSFHDGILKASQESANIDISKDLDLSWLPNPVTVAFGGQYLRQAYSIQAGDLDSYYTGTSGVSGGAQGFGGYQPSDAGSWSRDDFSEYVNAETNLTDKLGTSLSLRHENYSDFGGATIGSAAFRYDFTDRFALRASASNGFRAPSLAQEYYSYTSSTYYGPGNSIGVTPGIYNSAIVSSTSLIGRLLGGQALKPEHSRNYTFGAVWNPTDQLNLSADVYQININNRIVLSNALSTTSATVRDYLAANGVTDSNYSSVTYFTNAGNTRTRGIDLVAGYRFDFGNAGVLQTNLSYNYNQNVVTKVNGNPAVLDNLGLNLQRLSRRDIRGLLANTTPRSKLILNGNYTVGNWSFNASVTRYGQYTSVSTSSYIYDQTFRPAWITDLALSYNLRNWSFTIGADNAMNIYPGKVNAINGYGSNSGTMQYSIYSPYGFNGGYYYTKATFRW
ncbi:TonB-dependent receptor plug domain-containing protein [Frateuria aurantia]